MKFYWISIALLLSLLLGGCDPSKPLPSTPLPASPIQGDKPQINPFSSISSVSGLEGLIEKAAKDDLSTNTQVL